MKISEMVRLKALISFLFLIYGNYIFSQEIRPFYSIKENIKINNPIIIGIKNYYNLFITDKSNLTKDFDIEKLLSQGKVFLYNDDTTFSDIINDEDKHQLGSCEDISKNYVIKNKFVIFNLPKGVSRFHFGFTTLLEYDKRMKNPHEKAYIKVNNQFYPILIPICENN